MKAYRTESWEADGYAYAKVTFAFPGLGNTGPAEQIKHNGLRSAKRAVRLRAGYHVRCVIVENKIDSLNRLHSLTVRGERKEEQ